MSLPDEFQGLPLSAEDEIQIGMWQDGEAENNTVDLSTEAVEAIRSRIAELSEIVRQNALVTIPEHEGDPDA